MSAKLCEYLGRCRHLGVFVSSVTHHCLMKLETRRNTNLDIAGYLYDIGHVKLTVAVRTHRQAPTAELLQTIAFLLKALQTLQMRQTKQLQSFFFLFFLFPTILSNNPNLNLVFLICVCQKLGLCINYMFFARSLAGPEDIKNYSLCQCGVIGPLWIRRPVDEGTGPHDPPPKTLTFILKKPLAPSFSPPSSCSPTSLTTWCQRNREHILLLLFSQWEALFRHSSNS